MKVLQMSWWRDEKQLASYPVGVASTAWERARGLLGVNTLTAGLWLSPCNSIHMWFMKIPLDIVYLDKEQRVLRCVENLKPWQLSACWKAKSVIEMPAGWVAQTGLLAGDKMTWQE